MQWYGTRKPINITTPILADLRSESMIGIQRQAIYVIFLNDQYYWYFQIIQRYNFFCIPANERIAYDFKKLPSDQLPYGPDGLTIDTNGFLYSGSYNGSAVYKIDPKFVSIIYFFCEIIRNEDKYFNEFHFIFRTSKIVQKIDFPAQIVKSLGFGGLDLDILFSTSSSVPLVPGTGQLDKTQKLAPLSGSLFAINGLGAKGYSSQNLDKSFASCAPKKGFF